MRKLYYLSLLCIAVLFYSCENEQLEGEFATSNTTASCGDATLVLQENTLALLNATDEDYELVCTNYRLALEGLLENCQDEFEEDFATSIMQLIDQVGDCTVNTNFCADAQAVSATAATAFENAEEDDEDELCSAYATALEAEIAACGDTDGSIQQTLNTLPCTACGEATLNAEEAQLLFSEADPMEQEEYEALCGLYSSALQNQIAVCGDPDGSLTAIIEELGDCTPPEEDGPVRLILAGSMKNFNTADVSINGTTLSVLATDTDTGDTFTFDIVLQQTGTNVAQDIELTVDGELHTPFMSGETPFTNNITENTGTVIVGTFTGTVVNPDGDFVATTNGVIDIEY